MTNADIVEALAIAAVIVAVVAPSAVILLFFV